MTTHRAIKPAIVRGSEMDAIAVFIEDSHGDLVEINYYCGFIGCDFALNGVMPLPWPAYDFGDSDIHCVKCGELINRS